MRAVGNHEITTLGSIICDITINGHHYPWEIYISTGNETVGCLLGMDFLLDNQCELILHSGHLKINGARVKLLKESHRDTIARVRLERDVTLPPNTETTVTGWAEASKKNSVIL